MDELVGHEDPHPQLRSVLRSVSSLCTRSCDLDSKIFNRE